MEDQPENAFLNKGDIIRMHQLVRGRVDFQGFLSWFGTLTENGQSALVSELCNRAYQAGVNETIYEKACSLAGLNVHDQSVAVFKGVQTKSGLNIGGLKKWLCEQTIETRLVALKLFVYLFSEAEAWVMANEDRNLCNHWWHRDLNNDAVVQSILADPEYYKTSPRDDAE